MLKYICPAEAEYFAKEPNSPLPTLTILDILEEGSFVPLIKVGKPTNKEYSYPPIYILSLVAKTYKV